ncbi:tripartite motif-containing protein 60-like [Suncus etruscus]|uniref:tripartite motif-containing protein 60-like n=1 Tax=Suncus etruscus TaxID=109475 RepID=UPI00211066BF|nr:tripartite motif-containing protein 60-like [Suncus etruscus]
MALEASLAELHAAARCPVCQDFLKEPMTLSCGHNCCGSCLQQHWRNLQGVLPCPVCLHPCRHWHPQKNMQLGQVADLVQQILCMRDDLELLCGQCAASPDHQAHVLTPITQAAAHHKEKLKSCLEHLGKQLEEAERALARQESEKQALKEKVQRQSHQFHRETEHFKYHLQDALKDIDSGAHSEMGFITDALRKNQMDLSDYAATLGSLLRDATRQSLQTDLGLLLQVEQVHQLSSRLESLQFPAVYSAQIPKENLAVLPHYMGLHNLITKFQEHMTFDPETAHPSLDISPDRRTVAFSLENRPCPSAFHPRAFTSSYTAILGSQGFNSGRHFWQVEIRGTGMWSIGVCKDSYPRNLLMSQCWAFGMYFSQEPQETPSHIGVFLDLELGQISFYSLRSRAHLHTITTPFQEKLWPYFFLSGRTLNFSMTLV